MKSSQSIDQLFNRIANEHLYIETLETQHRDRLDFHEVAVWGIKCALAAAYAAFNRLKNKIGTVTPGKILSLTDEELRACYFTRQKIVYAKGLAEAVQSRTIQLKKMESLPDEEVRARLIQLKGIGNWTVDVYLMHALRRTDLFPLGDLALVNSLKQVKKLKPETSKEKMLAIAEPWRPYRTIASMILWHDYLKRKGTKIQD